MIQMRKAEKDPKKAITFPNPGRRIAVIVHTPVMTILEITLRTRVRFSLRLSLDSSSSVSELELRCGLSIGEVRIWDSSPGKRGWIDKIDSIVIFNCHVSLSSVSPLLPVLS